MDSDKIMVSLFYAALIVCNIYTYETGVFVEIMSFFLVMPCPGVPEIYPFY